MKAAAAPRLDHRVPQIDGLRCFSILAVLGVHLGLLPGGGLGVDVFFVISGYLITGILLREFNRTGVINLRNFYIRRVLRTVPAFLVLLLAYAAIVALFARHKQDEYMSILYAATYIMNWARMLEWNGGLIPHTWTLAVEEQFYLVWPLCLIVIVKLSRGWQRGAIALLIAASFLWRCWLIYSLGNAAKDHVMYGSDTRAMELFTGCLLAILPLRPAPAAVSALWFLPAGVVLALVIFGVPPWLDYFDSALVSLSAAWLIAAIQIGKSASILTLLGARPVTWIGRLSYSLYLWHFPIFIALTHNNQAALPLTMAGAVAASLVAAMLSYYFVEQPALRLKARFSAAPMKS